MLHTYIFRAECLADVELFKELHSEGEYTIKPLFPGVPDVEVTLVTTTAMALLRQLMGSIEEGDVMLQTLSPIEDYNEERNYRLRRGICVN